MRHTLKTAKTMMPVALSTLVLVGAAPQVAIAAQNTQSTPVSNVGGYRDSDSSLPPVRETLTQKEAEDLPGCEAYFDKAKKEVVIRPKNGANEGVISYSLANKKDDFHAINDVLHPEDGSIVYDSVRFDKRVYVYDSTDTIDPTDSTIWPGLFYHTSVKTINITDNLNIKFAKNLANLFSTADGGGHLHYIKGIENWDTSNVENMQLMFNFDSNLEGKLDLSKWNVSKVDTFRTMFSSAGNYNGNFVLDFSNKKFKNQADIDYMFADFRGVLVANNWTLEDPNGSTNPIQGLLAEVTNILSHYDYAQHIYVQKSAHLLITDNPTILTKNQTAKYKFYKKVKVIYKTNGTEKSVELELPAVYDSRIDENGKPDTTKAASSDPMKVVKPQIDEAIKNAVKEMRTKNPDLNLPESVIPVPMHEVKDTDSPTALFQTYYLATVKEEVTKVKTTYTADPNLEYKKVEYDTNPQDGKKQVITGTIKNGAWDPDAISEKEITTAVDGKARVGNKEVKTEDIQPGVTYEADSSLTYKQEQTTEGTKGTKTTTTIYKVDEDTGLTNTVQSTESKTTTAAKDKVIKVGNKEVIQNNDGSTTTKTYKVNPNDGTLSDPTVETTRPWTDIASGAAVSEVLKGKMTYVADELLPYGQTQKVSDPKDGEKITTPTGKVENGKWVEGEPKVEITAAVNGVTKVGNKKVKTEDIQPGVTYEADSSLTYKQEQTTEGTKGTKTTTTIYKVDEDTGLTNTVQSTESKTTTAAKDKVIKVGNVKTETETIKCKTVYIADDTIEYNTQQDKTAGNDGSKTVTTTYKVNKTTGLTTDVESIKGKKVDPTDHVVRVGNKQVTHDGDKTITTTYDVDPNTGKLTNPQKHTSMSWSDLIPAKPVTPDTDNHESDNSGDNAGTNAATATSASQPKHMKQTPKTGDMGSFGALLSSLGLSLMGFATLHKKKH